MKTGIVVEGVGMRGISAAGVLDVLLEHGIKADGLVGVSAGAIHGCSFVAGQAGRSIRYNLKYCRDPRYMSFRSLVTTGDLVGNEFCYHELPERLDPFDNDAFEASPMEFYATCTDVETGRPVYHRCDSLRGENIQWIRASASMPLVSRIVEIDGHPTPFPRLHSAKWALEEAWSYLPGRMATAKSQTICSPLSAGYTADILNL